MLFAALFRLCGLTVPPSLLAITDKVIELARQDVCCSAN
jgi:hypothetical protein